VVGRFEHGKEPSSSVKGEFIEQLSDYQPVKKESAPWR
jgi:hypothetical protein